MSMIFQKAALLPHVKVRDNISYGLKAAGYSRSEIRNMVDETASLLHITSLLDRYPAKLSGGEAQRVDMARAIVRRPDVLLMDEPFSSLDRRLARQLEKEIAALCEKFDIMRVMVSHEMEDAMRFTGKIVYLSHGRLIEEGTADSLMDRPQQLETARFFGQPSMQETVCTVRNHHVRILQEDMETEADDGTYTALFRPYWIEEGKGYTYGVQSCRRYMDHYEVLLSDGMMVCTHVPCDTAIVFGLKKVLLYNTDGQLCSICTG
jgi:ABC-type sugar transport system ATPase subunit